MSSTELADFLKSRFEEAKARVLGAQSLRLNSGETCHGEPVKPAGILAHETIAPDRPDRGQIRHFLVLAEHVPPQLWSFEDDGSSPPGTEGLLLAQLDDNFELAGWDDASKTLNGLMFETCEVGGSMEMLSASYEGTRNFRVRILFNELRSTEDQDRALSAARQKIQETGLPQEFKKYVEILCKTEDQEAFREAAFEIWNHEELVRKHLTKLSTDLIVPVIKGVESVDIIAALWICRQLCAFDCPAESLGPYAILLCQHSLNPPLSDADGRRTFQWAAIEGLMNVTSRLPAPCAALLVEAITAELEMEHPYGAFIEHAIYVLGSIGSPEVRPVLEQLQPAFPDAVFQALDTHGQATPAQIKAKAEACAASGQ